MASPDQEVGLAVVVDDKADGLKENSILRVGMLDFLRLWWLLSLVENGLKTLVQSRSDSWILWWGIVLKKSQKLDREPRGGHEVVGVVLEVCVGGCHDPRQPGYGQGDAALVLLGILLDQGVNQRGRSGDHAHVLVIKEVDNAASPLTCKKENV